ncbi:hypothetical protein EZS27_038860, partial [termite gut metagenome]
FFVYSNYKCDFVFDIIEKSSGTPKEEILENTSLIPEGYKRFG